MKEIEEGNDIYGGIQNKGTTEVRGADSDTTW